ncbi:MAG: hypothetical protein GY861_16840, partial [bacterium]|nr:hypothetical protein [bacterium]
KVFLNPHIKKVFQGGSYDLSILGRYYGLRLADGTYEDTMLCHHASYPYIKKGLEVLTSIYTWEPYYKDEGKVGLGKTRGGDKAEFIYNAKDCCVTREIFPIVARNARNHSTWDGYRRSMSIQPSLLGMMIRGVRIDLKRKAQLGSDFKARAQKAQEAVNESAGGDYNLNSSNDKRRLLYGYLGFKVQYNRSTGKVTTDKDALQKLKKLHPREEILQHILDFQKFSKLNSTYAEMEIDTDNRVHTSYGLVSTWRLSSSESPFGSGGNLQNIPVQSEEGRMVRSLFIPDEGREFLACDLSQAEARVVAWESDDLELIEMFTEGKYDIHWENTKKIFRIPKETAYEPTIKFQDEFTGGENSLKTYRDLGKRIIHATNYDMGPMGFQASLSRDGFHFPFATCKALLETTKAARPMLAEWKRKIREELHANRTIISSYGRKREFMARLNEQLFRTAYAFSPQNTVGEILQVAIQRIWRECDYLEVLLNIHDEVLVQVRPKDRKRAMKDIKERMEIPLLINDRELVIPCDFKAGDDWGNLKEVG